jgi:hypothetical protein
VKSAKLAKQIVLFVRYLFKSPATVNKWIKSKNVERKGKEKKTSWEEEGVEGQK